MTWVKSGENLYTHDQAPFIIENLNGSWGIRDTRDKTSFIPFSDIFNNPVFPIDLSNADVIVKTLNSIGEITGNTLTAIGVIAGNSLNIAGLISGDSLSIANASLSKHFRGESANTPSTPAFSFQGDVNSGFYRIAEDTIGGAVGGNKVFEVNALGLQNGTLGTDLRNILNTTLINKPFAISYSMPAGTTAITTGLNFSYTPKLIGSRILINLICPVSVSTAINNSVELFLYATATALASGLTPAGGNYLNPDAGLIGYDLGNISNNTMSFPLIFWHTPTSLSPIIFNLIARNRVSSSSTTGINSSSFGSQRNLVTIQELN